jgi:uncharacterized protein (TIGR01777 family)
MQVVIFGGSGFIGTQLQKLLRAKGHEVTLGDLRRDMDWEGKIQKADAVVNLAGAPIIGKRWNMLVKAEIHDSRVEGTHKIVAALGKAKAKDGKERVLVNGSAIGFYGATQDEELDETSPAGTDFLAFVCRDWEDEAHKAELEHGIRTVILRTGIVLGKGGGALEKMLPPFKLGLGGPIGNGQQWYSWIHIDDECGLIVHALENKQVRGVLNATAPMPVRNKDFAKTLGAVLSRPAFLPVPPPALYLLVGEASFMLTHGQKVLPKAALASGYAFRYKSLDDALKASI